MEHYTALDTVFSVQCFHAEQIGCELERCAQEINKVFLFVVICGSAACTTGKCQYFIKSATLATFALRILKFGDLSYRSAE